ncbi:hypothetical protein [Saccharothrix coeruleofusca]|uniref:Uncharacterized protein n=1 Tax=Saccharothrix coeruleofusca TaxID=33919 RepID=A0A918AHF4_9PSEU|nr:hypothetical protein [Saccharothrix coeruleofusca]MBP2340054.1 fatty acid desaturase [Saccharothrix coeruleofusca]GGP37661.1 hypothetical protein GCM10010185_06280 [Saccharothrix coeruleofusca]
MSSLDDFRNRHGRIGAARWALIGAVAVAIAAAVVSIAAAIGWWTPVAILAVVAAAAGVTALGLRCAAPTGTSAHTGAHREHVHEQESVLMPVQRGA